ncbi:ABC transporter permease [Fructobacillus ficulneus]|uniref:Putative integral membrane protein n=1 Tax=Fructobacillus ficulneus TaxID=157463 RepID=A0A0K8MH57_9LACO|nr:ABC transporter permease [Fructobacillus ficulneus]GAO99802.1 putative integral membrane protein [Fructobacillus ficulneus]
MKSSYKFILGLALGLTVVLGIMMTAFSLPAVKSGINNVPIGLVAPNEATYDKLAKPLSDKGFKVKHYDSTADVKDAVNHRKIYGAFEMSATGDLSLYQATAASAAVAQGLNQIGQGVVTQQKAAAKAQLAPMMAQTTDLNTLKALNAKSAAVDTKTLKVVELKSFPKADPKGTGLAAGALPIALGGWIGAVAIANMIKGKKQKFYAALAFAFIGGLGLVGVIQFGVGTFDGNYFLTSLGAMVGIAATAFFVLGLLEVMGNGGLGIAAVMLILLGNPLSGLSSAPEMLPKFWGALGQLLPPGATGTLLRDIAFFNGNGIAKSLTVLLTYVVVGWILFTIGKKSVIDASTSETNA